MRRGRQRVGCALLLSLLLAAAGCGGEKETVPAGKAGIVIQSPTDGSSVPAGGITVSVTASNFKVVDKLNQAPVAGEGHVHFFVDVAEGDVPTEKGKPAVSAEGTYHAIATTTYTWPDVKAGTHTFCAELVNNNHTPLEPEPQVDCVTVTVT